MNKSELIAKIADETNLSKADVGRVLDSVGEIAKAEMLLEEGELTLPGIGKLKATVKPSRQVRNPKTGETFMSDQKNGVKLVVAKEMKDAIN